MNLTPHVKPLFPSNDEELPFFILKINSLQQPSELRQDTDRHSDLSDYTSCF